MNNYTTSQRPEIAVTIRHELHGNATFITTREGDLILSCEFGVFGCRYPNRNKALEALLTELHHSDVIQDFELTHLTQSSKPISPVFRPKIEELIGCFLLHNKRNCFLNEARNANQGAPQNDFSNPNYAIAN